MKITSGVLGLALVAARVQAGLAQSGDAAKPAVETVEKTFYLHNVSQIHDVEEVQVAMRNLLDPGAKLFYVPSQNAILMRASRDQVAQAQKIMDDLDRPKKTYRLTYTFAESDSGKKIGEQHTSVVVVSGQKTTVKNGSKVPIETGTYSENAIASKVQMTYIDVGLNIDATLDEATDGVRLRSRIEQSSVAEEKSGVGPQDPVIRQAVMEGASILTQGKPLMLGSIDVPGSTRHMDVQVVMELVK